ncbi:xylose isomerase [Salipaludibacillus neizhouensis]|uniref:Xylose isomerase n=1 Tax=Salipaludibacillus neizhouensis TaxID=885475 RepID=A0A3A9K806_9BACI|nr:sugar phosphate isomerase/epimerase family protein [Salipaludibacillus neizhouensis]RKL66960.1 xylose isomerase [Salipaludibacillus neizhouensis]
MIKGLSKAGIGDVGEIKQYIHLASKYNFKAIDIDGHSLTEFIKTEGLINAKKFLEDHKVAIGSIGLDVEWRKSEEDFKKGLTQLLSDAKAASSLGCRSCITYIFPSTDMNAAQFMSVATRRLRLCSQILGGFGMRFGLEFVGPHHLRTSLANPFIWNLEQTLDFVDAIGEPNVGLLLDSYHCYTTEFRNEEVSKLDSNQIIHVHINDARPLPVKELLDNDRLYPGEGVIDLPSFLQALKQAGYRGPVTQEVLTPNALKEPAEVLIKKSSIAYSNLFKKAGLD